MSLSVEDCLRNGFATSKPIQVKTGLSQSSVARQLRSMVDHVVKLASGRSLEYAPTCNAFAGDDKLPLFMVDAQGADIHIANIRPLAHGGYFVQASAVMPKVLLGEAKNGLFEDFPANPRRWNANHIGRYLISNGDDLPRNFKLGHHIHLRIRKKSIPTTEKDYPTLAESVIHGDNPGSSAGGEQPKFTTFCGEKFSPKGDEHLAQWKMDI